MKSLTLTFLLIQTLISNCGHSLMGTRTYNGYDDYKDYKAEFDSSFTNQFPLKLGSEKSSIIAYTNEDKNTVGLILYEYDVDTNEISIVKLKLNSFNIIAQYASGDSCLLIVNRFESIETRNNFEIPVIVDSSKINNDCYERLYPIPNFIDYSIPNLQLDMKLDSSFVIYVLEARSGNHFEKYQLSPDPQMPDKWKNGYSKGIALSEEKKTVIYWSIIW